MFLSMARGTVNCARLSRTAARQFSSVGRCGLDCSLVYLTHRPFTTHTAFTDLIQTYSILLKSTRLCGIQSANLSSKKWIRKVSFVTFWLATIWYIGLQKSNFCVRVRVICTLFERLCVVTSNAALEYNRREEFNIDLFRQVTRELDRDRWTIWKRGMIYKYITYMHVNQIIYVSQFKTLLACMDAHAQVGEMGFPGITVPEEYGGVGMDATGS